MAHRIRKRSQSSSTSEARSRSRRSDAGHYEWHEGQVLHSRYRVTRLLGDGTFGRVLEVTDTDGTVKAVKVIRAVRRYVEAARIEVQVLKEVQRFDPTRQSNIVELLDDFELGENYCLVFERLGKSLFDVIKLNKYKGQA